MKNVFIDYLNLVSPTIMIMKNQFVIEMKNVTKIYKVDSVNVIGVENINLKIKKGEFVCVMGPSGSGKSTMLHLMGCLDKPTYGKVLIDGVDASRMSDDELADLRKYKIGFVFQFFNLYPTLTALENVELPMIIAEKDKEFRKKRAIELLKMVEMEEFKDYLPSQLSGGQRQKIAIARALANDPPIILADEPTGNLDSKSGEEVIKIFKELNKKGKTIVVVTHNENVAKFAERIIRLKDGKIIKDERK
jgi:putative ABC transport system ATP-binding protein